MRYQELHLNTQGARLVGTLCTPKAPGPFPVVLMVHGSGPLDRNENTKNQRLDLFNTLATALAANGVASLRYDKRGCGASSGDFFRTGHRELVADAIEWIDALERLDSCDSTQIFVLGHSEGSIIAPQVFLNRPALAGLALLCPFADNIETILMAQARQLESELDALPGWRGKLRRQIMAWFGVSVIGQARLIAEIKTSTADMMRVDFKKVPARWFRELFALEPKAIYSQVSCPTLIIGGEKDLQCAPADVAVIAELMSGVVESHVIDNMTHTLRLDKEQPGLLRTPLLLGQPVAPPAMALITGWFSKRTEYDEAQRSAASKVG